MTRSGTEDVFPGLSAERCLYRQGAVVSKYSADLVAATLRLNGKSMSENHIDVTEKDNITSKHTILLNTRIFGSVGVKICWRGQRKSREECGIDQGFEPHPHVPHWHVSVRIADQHTRCGATTAVAFFNFHGFSIQFRCRILRAQSIVEY